MEIDPRRLRVLLAIARTGGVLAAADELRITPSAASQQLNKLEDETGHALVVRTPRGSVLTPAGLAMAEAAEEIERALNVARARMEGGAELTGIVRVGGFTSFLRTIVIPRLPEWRLQYPQLQIRIVEDDLPALMRLLRQRELDAVVVELDSATAEQRSLPAGMSEEPLLDEPWKLVVPSGALLATENLDLARLPLPWLGVEATAANASVIGRLRRATGAQVETVHQYQETLTALALVAAGEGVAVVPALALSRVVQDGVDVLDVPGLGTRRVVLRRFDRRRSISMPVDTVARLLRESVAAFDTLVVAPRPGSAGHAERRAPS
ncbi:LysR family transcriptional regulator [Arthrobacter mobilis]|uniref:LysR family transcriptional regulator n=1 Tax=Arthrobacter mobilis TaxID=2724944 RepID=A0A7X6HGA6_9MICC|nr:LysR family transcriptional regulator [Arthrobacter mobilis]NKX55623.1 LysR family transcriptional regulator [Arthrobacter mobilis]